MEQQAENLTIIERKKRIMSEIKTGISDIGFLITDDIANIVHVSAGGIYDTVKENAPDFNIQYLRGFTGSVKTVTTPDCEPPVKNPINADYKDQDLVYIPIKNMPTLFHQTYHTVEELAEEIQKTLNDIEIRLKDGTRYIRNVVVISGIAG